MGAIGADVKNWSYKTDCCGGSLAISKTSYRSRYVRQADERREGSRGQLCRDRLSAVHGQPGYATQSSSLKLPVFYFTELISLAMGLPGSAETFKSHMFDPQPLMRQLRLI